MNKVNLELEFGFRWNEIEGIKPKDCTCMYCNSKQILPIEKTNDYAE